MLLLANSFRCDFGTTPKRAGSAQWIAQDSAIWLRQHHIRRDVILNHHRHHNLININININIKFYLNAAWWMMIKVTIQSLPSHALKHHCTLNKTQDTSKKKSIFHWLHHNRHDKSNHCHQSRMRAGPQTLQRWEGTLCLWSFLSHRVLANIPDQDRHHHCHPSSPRYGGKDSKISIFSQFLKSSWEGIFSRSCLNWMIFSLKRKRIPPGREMECKETVPFLVRGETRDLIWETHLIETFCLKARF